MNRNKLFVLSTVLVMCMTVFAGMYIPSDNAKADASPIEIVAGELKYFTYSELGLSSEQVSTLRNNSGQITLSDNDGQTILTSVAPNPSARFFDSGASISVSNYTAHGGYTLNWIYGSDKTHLCSSQVVVINEHDGTSIASPYYHYTDMSPLSVQEGFDRIIFIERGSYVSISFRGSSTSVTISDNCGLGLNSGGSLSLGSVLGTLTADGTVTIAGKYVYRFILTDPHYDSWLYDSDYSCSYTPFDGTETDTLIGSFKNMEIPAIVDVDITVNQPFASVTIPDGQSLEGLTISPLHVKNHSADASAGEIYHISGNFYVGQNIQINSPNSVNYATLKVTAYEPLMASYTVTYDANGASGVMDNTVVSIIGGGDSEGVDTEDSDIYYVPLSIRGRKRTALSRIAVLADRRESARIKKILADSFTADELELMASGVPLMISSEEHLRDCTGFYLRRQEGCGVPQIVLENGTTPDGIVHEAVHHLRAVDGRTAFPTKDGVLDPSYRRLPKGRKDTIVSREEKETVAETVARTRTDPVESGYYGHVPGHSSRGAYLHDQDVLSRSKALKGKAAIRAVEENYERTSISRAIISANRRKP